MTALKRIGWPAVFAIAALLAVTGVARAAVEDYIPADAIGFVKMQDPVGQFDSLTGGALFKKLEDPAFVPALAAGIDKARQGIAAFEAQEHVNVHQVLSDLLGREVALAALPNDEGAGIIVGRDATSLQAAVDEFLRIQRETGDLTAESTSTYKGVTVYSGMQKQGERYHALVGNVLVVSSQADAVQKVIDVLKGAPSLGATDACKQAAKMTDRGAAVTGFLNGAALQPLAQKLMEPGSDPSDVGQKLIRERLADFLQQVDYGVLGVSGDGALRVQLTFVYRNGRIPDALRAALPKPGSSLDVQRPGAEVERGRRRPQPERQGRLGHSGPGRRVRSAGGRRQAEGGAGDRRRSDRRRLQLRTSSSPSWATRWACSSCRPPGTADTRRAPSPSGCTTPPTSRTPSARWSAWTRPRPARRAGT